MKFSSLAFLVLLSFLFFLPARSQQYNFRGFSVQDGLPQSSVFDLIQDSRGYLWLGTLGGGVSRFDGESFRTWDAGNGLPGNMVRSIYEDRAGQLWFGTDRGLCLYDGYEFFTIAEEQGLLGSQVLSIFESSSGELWVGTDQGLNRLVIAGDSVIINPFGANQGLGSGLVFDIEEDSRGRLWLATYQDGVLVLMVEDGQITAKESIGLGRLPSNTILDLEKDSRGNFWVATGNAGACYISIPEGGGEMEISRIGLQEGLLDLTVYDIEIDHRGRIWLATGAGGLYRYSGGMMEVYGEEQGAPSNQILSVLEDRNNQIWAGSNDFGFFRLLGEHFFHFTEEGKLPHDAVTGVVQAAPGRYFLGTFGGGLCELTTARDSYSLRVYGRENGLPDLFINGLSMGPDGVLWIATNDHGLVRYNGKSFRQYTIFNGLVSNHVNAVLADSGGHVWCGTRSGICRFNGDGFFCISAEDEFGLVDNTVNSIIEDRWGNVWAGTMGGLVRFTGNSMTDYDETDGLSYKNINTLCEGPDGKIWIGTFGGGLFVYDPLLEDSIPVCRVADKTLLSSNNIFSLGFLNDSTLLAGTDRGIDRIQFAADNELSGIRNYNQSDGFTGMENNDNAICIDSEGRAWLGTVHGLTMYDPRREEVMAAAPTPSLNEISLLYEEVDWAARGIEVMPWFHIPETMSLPFSDNHLTFHFRSVSLSNPEKMMYSHRLLYNDTVWSPPRKETQVTYSGLNPGEYVFEVRAMNETGNWSHRVMRYSFIINPPFYQTWWFILTMVIMVLACIVAYIKWREKRLIREKKELEDKVNERTREIRRQKNEIEEKNKSLEQAFSQISLQKSEIEQKNRDITSSIEYARRIQSAMLPSGKILDETLDGYFIFYLPKDIVSGDFYWIRKKGNRLVLVAADCTGHGVPGAFMSMLGISFLDEIVEKENVTDPSHILNMLRENIVVALKQADRESESKDGMDMCVVELDLSSRQLRYSGANNSLYIVSDGMLEEITSDRMPVAIHEKMEPFSLHSRTLQAGTCLYLFSDGFADQFGGSDGKKYKYRPFKELLLKNSHRPMPEQLEGLENEFRNWIRGGNGGTVKYEQVDDILVMGFRIA